MEGTREVASITDRFWAKVDRSGECWLWTASVRRDGYGNFNRGSGDGWVSAHRFSYELHHGPIPARLLVLHSCDNRRCVNPSHLSLGTHRDNTRDAITKGRFRCGEFQSAKTHCVHGHAFDADNTIVSQRSGRRPERSCRECSRMRTRVYKKRQRDKARMAVAS